MILYIDPALIGADDIIIVALSVVLTAGIMALKHRRKQRREWYNEGRQLMERAIQIIEKGGLFENNINPEQVRDELNPIGTKMIVHSDTDVKVDEESKFLIKSLGMIITGWVKAIEYSDDTSTEAQIVELQQEIQEHRAEGDISLEIEDLEKILSIVLAQKDSESDLGGNIFSSIDNTREFMDDFFGDMNQLQQAMNESIDEDENIPDEVDDLIGKLEEGRGLTMEDILNFPISEHKEKVGKVAGPVDQKVAEYVLKNLILVYKKEFERKT